MDIKNILNSLGLGIKESVKDYRTKTDPLYRMGLLNSIFGDNSMLNNYYQMQNANKQAEENRKAQQEYNTMIKSMEEAKQNQQRYNAAEKELAENLQKPNRTVADDIRAKQIIEEFPELNEGGILEQINKANADIEAKKAADAATENDYQYNLANFRTTLPTTFKTDADKTKIYESIRNSEYRNEDKAKMLDEIRAIESSKTARAKARQGAGANYAATKTTQALTETDNKAEAKKLVGTHMTKLQWDKLDNNVKQYLKINGQGIVGFKIKG